MTRFTTTPFGRRVTLAILGLAFIASATVIVAFSAFAPSSTVRLAVGQVAASDILSPRGLTYETDVLTKLARQAAADGVRDVYDPPNPAVLRQQLQLAHHVLDYIDNVRNDTFADLEQQAVDLAAITVLPLSADISTKLLKLRDDAWKDVGEQFMSILERTLRGEVREENLKSIYANLPNLVSVAMDETQTAVILALVRDLIRPNTFYNEERTREAKRAASAAVTTETRTYAPGQIVVRAGTIVTEADMEALTQLKLLEPPDKRLQALASAFLAVMLVSAVGAFYLRRFHTNVFNNVPSMILIGGFFLAFLGGARVFSTTNEFQAFLYPAAALSLVIVALAGPQASITITSGLALLIGLMDGNSLQFTVLVAFGGIAGVLSLHRSERLNTYFRAGMVIGVANITVGTLFALQQSNLDPIRILAMLGAGLLSGILSAGLAVVGLYLTSTIFNMPTSVRLIELSQPNQPLLQRLLREAPGTYQHSLQVANLAELAAERIGANALLTRVAALYHDIGKITNPHFFIENQVEGNNPHDALDNPTQSATIIIRHVTDGARLAQRNGLPVALIDFIWQHHGTLPVIFFYNKALEAARRNNLTVDASTFRYPGPRPCSRESAIMMLADASESIVRAKRPRTKSEIEDIVTEIVDMRVDEGQLDDSGLTVNDLKVIREAFVSSLQGIFHPRIVYPTLTIEAVSSPQLMESVEPVESREALEARVTRSSSVPPLQPLPPSASSEAHS